MLGGQPYKWVVRYRHQLEHAALTLVTTSPVFAATISSTCGVRPCQREHFRRTARSIASRYEVRVVIEEDDGLSTATFFRLDDADIAV